MVISIRSRKLFATGLSQPSSRCVSLESYRSDMVFGLDSANELSQCTLRLRPWRGGYSAANFSRGARSCCQKMATPCSSCDRRTQVKSKTPANRAPVTTRAPNSRRQVSAFPPTSRCSRFHEFLGPLLTLHSNASNRPSLNRMGRSHLAPATFRSREKAPRGRMSRSMIGLRDGSKVISAASSVAETSVSCAFDETPLRPVLKDSWASNREVPTVASSVSAGVGGRSAASQGALRPSSRAVKASAIFSAWVVGTDLNFLPTSVQRSSSLTGGAQKYRSVCQSPRSSRSAWARMSRRLSVADIARSMRGRTSSQAA